MKVPKLKLKVVAIWVLVSVKLRAEEVLSSFVYTVDARSS